MRPIIGGHISTAFRKASTGLWRTCGWHTGVDYQAPLGTTIYAPIAGQIRHRSYGSDLGNHQFAISPDPDQPFGHGEVFFAHTRTRLADGTRVKAGDPIAQVGAEGNVTGPHLHLEYHSVKGRWACDVMRDPMPVLEWKPGRRRRAWLRARGRGGLIVR